VDVVVSVVVVVVSDLQLDIVNAVAKMHIVRMNNLRMILFLM
jgi:hypothetical protein